MEQDNETRPGPHRWAPGESGNRAGRKPGPHSLARAVREAWPTDRLVALASTLAESEDEGVRMRALEWLSDRGHGKAPTVIDATVSQGAPQLDSERVLSRLSDGALHELLAAHDAMTLEAGDREDGDA